MPSSTTWRCASGRVDPGGRCGGGDHLANLTLLLPDAKVIWRRCQWRADRLCARTSRGASTASLCAISPARLAASQNSAHAAGCNAHSWPPLPALPRQLMGSEQALASSGRHLRRHNFARDLRRYGRPEQVGEYCVSRREAGTMSVTDCQPRTDVGLRFNERCGILFRSLLWRASSLATVRLPPALTRRLSWRRHRRRFGDVRRASARDRQGDAWAEVKIDLCIVRVRVACAPSSRLRRTLVRRP